MNTERQVLTVAIEAGQRVLMHANGDPAKTLALGVAAAVAAIGTGIAFGCHKYGSKAIDWLVK